MRKRQEIRNWNCRLQRLAFKTGFINPREVYNARIQYPLGVYHIFRRPRETKTLLSLQPLCKKNISHNSGIEIIKRFLQSKAWLTTSGIVFTNSWISWRGHHTRAMQLSLPCSESFAAMEPLFFKIASCALSGATWMRLKCIMRGRLWIMREFITLFNRIYFYHYARLSGPTIRAHWIP